MGNPALIFLLITAQRAGKGCNMGGKEKAGEKKLDVAKRIMLIIEENFKTDDDRLDVIDLIRCLNQIRMLTA